MVLTVEAKEGYELSKVTFNGTELQKNSNGKYDIIIVAGENVLKTEYKALGESDTSANENSTSSDSSTNEAVTDPGTSGCGSSISLGMVAAMAILASAVILRQRKEN